jgi:hypothetical protein
LCSYHIDCNFWWNNFCHEFSMFETCTFFFSFIIICTHLRCYITNDVDLVICALCEKEWLKTLMDQKRKDIWFSSMFFLCIFLVKNYFHMHFDHLIKILWIISLLYSTSHMISIHLHFYKHVLNDMGVHLSKEKKRN